VKTYREIFEDFRRKYPEILVSEATFKRCRPFFVRPATNRDLEQCCCQTCVNIRKAFRSLMNFRRTRKLHPVFDSVHDMVTSTLCQKEDGSLHHSIKFLKQECENCGLKLLHINEEEHDTSDKSMVTWFRYEKVEFTSKTGNISKNLDIMKKKNSPE